MTNHPVLGRASFELPEDVVWLNGAQMSPLHKRARAAAEQAILRKTQPWRGRPASYFPELETARARFGALAGVAPDCVAMVPSCSYAMATAAQNLAVSPGGRIVTQAGQFPSNSLIWRRKADEAGATFTAVGRDPDTEGADALVAAIDARTEIVACDPLFWSDGARLDIQRVARRTREVGAALVLDLTQTLGAAPLDLSAVDPDFAACPTYKWLLGPYGQGFLYVAERHHQGRPLEESDGARERGVGGGYLPGARRFDMGEKAHFHLTPVTIAGLELVLEAGVAAIGDGVRPIAARLADGLAARGWRTPPDHLRSCHILGARPPLGVDPQRVANALEAAGVYVSARDGGLRLSPHLWISPADEALFWAAFDAAATA